MIKTCEECKQDFNASRSVKRFCGSQCATDFQKNNAKPKVKAVCQKCFKEFVVASNAKGMYCSKSCSAKQNNKIRANNKSKKYCKFKNCSKEIKRSNIYCSVKCQRANEYVINLSKDVKCSSCGEIKHKDEYHQDKNRKNGIQSSCKKCNIKNVKDWQVKNYDEYLNKVLKRGKEPTILFKRKAKKYGLTVKELEILFEQADGKCEICKQKPNRWLVVDHCHNSQIVRGILCEQCNQALGLFKDNIQSILNAAEYLSKNKI